MLLTLLLVVVVLFAVSYPREKAPSVVATDPLRRDQTILFVNAINERNSSDHRIAKFKSGDERVSILSDLFPQDEKQILASPDKSMIAVTYFYAEAPPRTYILSVNGTQLAEPVQGGIACWASDSSKVYLSVMLGEAGLQYVGDGETGDEEAIFSLSISGEYKREFFFPQTLELDQRSVGGTFVARIRQFGNDTSEIRLLNDDGTNATIIRKNVGDMVTKLRWSPDGTKVLALHSVKRLGENPTYNILLLSQVADSWTSEIIVEGVLFDQPIWSPDGRAIVFSKQDDRGQHILRYDLALKSTKNITDFEKYTVRNPRFSSSGDLYFIASNGQSSEVWANYADGLVKVTDTTTPKDELVVL